MNYAEIKNYAECRLPARSIEETILKQHIYRLIDIIEKQREKFGKIIETGTQQHKGTGAQALLRSEQDVSDMVEYAEEGIKLTEGTE